MVNRVSGDTIARVRPPPFSLCIFIFFLLPRGKRGERSPPSLRPPPPHPTPRQPENAFLVRCMCARNEEGKGGVCSPRFSDITRKCKINFMLRYFFEKLSCSMHTINKCGQIAFEKPPPPFSLQVISHFATAAAFSHTHLVLY